MNNNLEQELSLMKAQIDQAKSERSQAIGRLETLKQNQNDLAEELEKLGIKPEELESTIQSLEVEIQELLAEAKKQMPQRDDHGSY